MTTQKTDEILINKAADAARESEYAVSVTDFRTPRERLRIHDAMVRAGYANGLFWYGGWRGAERAMAVFLPEWYLSDDAPAVRSGMTGAFDEAREAYFARLLADTANGLAESVPVCALEITGSGYTPLGHRDFMGALLGLGIEREVMGDIVLPEADRPRAVVFFQTRIVPYIRDSLTKIGRDSVRVTALPPDPTRVLERRYAPVSVVVTSPRIDAVVRSLAGTSREDAVELLRAGMVEHNYAQAAESDTKLSPGDVLSIRGHGKFRLQSDSGETRRGRLRLTFLKYE